MRGSQFTCSREDIFSFYSVAVKLIKEKNKIKDERGSGSVLLQFKYSIYNACIIGLSYYSVSYSERIQMIYN